MLTISRWASTHPKKARGLIVLIYLLINALALAAGNLLTDLSVILDESLIMITSIGLGGVILFYKASSRYRFRKTMDVLLGAGTFLVFLFYGNHAGEKQVYIPGYESLSGNYPATIRPSIKDSVNKKEKHQKIKAGKKDKKKERRKSDLVRSLLFLLVLAGAATLIYLLAALSCSIACSGAEATAWVVFILGTGGIVIGSYFLLRAILRKNPQKETASPSASN